MSRFFFFEGRGSFKEGKNSLFEEITPAIEVVAGGSDFKGVVYYILNDEKDTKS